MALKQIDLLGPQMKIRTAIGSAEAVFTRNQPPVYFSLLQAAVTILMVMLAIKAIVATIGHQGHIVTMHMTCILTIALVQSICTMLIVRTASLSVAFR